VHSRPIYHLYVVVPFYYQNLHCGIIYRLDFLVTDFSAMMSNFFKLGIHDSPVYESMLLYFAVFVVILTLKLQVPSTPLSFILNVTTTTHCTIILHSQGLKRLQNIPEPLACVVTSHITPVLNSLHRLKNERIKYKLLSLT